MIGYEDVLIREIARKQPKSKPSAAPGFLSGEAGAPFKPKKANHDEDKPQLRYATGGRADFDARSDIVRITEFPQAYQDNDTVTGDVIILHRDSDLVEVEHSNAFSEGTPTNQ